MCFIKMQKISHFLIGFIVVICFIGLVGCGKDDEGYTISYINTEKDGLVTKIYKPVADMNDKVALTKELIEQINKVPKVDSVVTAKMDKVNVLETKIDNSLCLVYFDQSYNEMKPEVELLYRTAVIKTLSQVEGITSVRFYVNETDATYSDGKRIGTMMITDFVDDSDIGIGAVEWKEVDIYFANKSGDKLVKTVDTFANNKNIPIEKIIVERIIKGPKSGEVYATESPNLKVLGVTVKDGVAFVNLSDNFTTDMVNVKNEIPIYSIVNSLCSLSNIDQVKIVVNGNSAVLFRDSINLDNSFSFNSAIIQK